MFLNIGSGYYLDKNKILVILSKDIINEKNKKVFDDFSKKASIINTCDEDKIKSYLYYRDQDGEIIYTSSFLPGTLYDRFENDWGL